MFPVDVVEVVKKQLALQRRPPDGLLHPSSHLTGSLRHAMLDVAGAPKIESDFISDVRLMTGTMWHTLIEEALQAQIEAPVQIRSEIKLNKWLPEGWSGTADWIFWHPEHSCWVLGDLKTIKGEGIEWVVRDGIKDEHMWQLSAYYWALAATGQPLWPEFGVLYLPMNNVPHQEVEPQLLWGQPLDRDLVWGRMEERWAQVTEYLLRITETKTFQGLNLAMTARDYFLNDKLAPVQSRVQRVYWDKKAGVFNLTEVPHWSAQFCSFPNELCDCNLAGTTKIGHYDLEGKYTPRKGFEEAVPLVFPAEYDIRRRRQAA